MKVTTVIHQIQTMIMRDNKMVFKDTTSDDIINKINNSPYCSKDESEKITKILDSLTPEDLEIVEEHKLIEIKRPIIPIVLGVKETRLLIAAMETSNIELPLANLLKSVVANGVSDINILCRLTDDSFQQTVDYINKGE